MSVVPWAQSCADDGPLGACWTPASSKWPVRESFARCDSLKDKKKTGKKENKRKISRLCYFSCSLSLIKRFPSENKTHIQSFFLFGGTFKVALHVSRVAFYSASECARQSTPRCQLRARRFEVEILAFDVASFQMPSQMAHPASLKMYCFSLNNS